MHERNTCNQKGGQNYRLQNCNSHMISIKNYENKHEWLQKGDIINNVYN